MSSEHITNLPEKTETLLLVDDEPNILSALHRLFRSNGYRIITAEGAAQGLLVIAHEKIDLVISDMRMPEIDGARFLEEVRVKSPDSIRILLTGYADLDSTIAAINKGQIYRYITKPWEDKDILLTVRQALDFKKLEREKARLEELTLLQNEELRVLNASLEEKVRIRTEELRQAMESLESAHEKLKKGFLTSIRIFSNMLELREGSIAGHSRRVADLALKLATRLEMSKAEAQEVMIAALLHDIGKIGLPDNLLNKPLAALTADERVVVNKHPVTGQMTLMGLDQLNESATLIRHHHERFDGYGFPDRLSGTDIPLGSRILAIVNDYDSAQFGYLLPKQLNPVKALAYIKDGRKSRYDPDITDVFLEMMGGSSRTIIEKDRGVSTAQLKEGMVLARDFLSENGTLLLAKDYIISLNHIEMLRNYERMNGEKITIYVR
ncbi:MAG: response regulator [Betaproteobacteria bacterium]|nr:response regulator [Betaproteobacteria bacterium]